MHDRGRAMTSKTALKKLRELLDAETYAAVIGLLAGATVYFPSNTEVSDREERNLQIEEDFYSGQYEIIELAQKYNLSVSRIYKIIQAR